MIVAEGTDLQIAIYHLGIEPFRHTPGKLVFYGDDHGDLLAFETAFKAENTDLLTLALKWYAAYLDYPEMNLLLRDPRPLVN